MPVQTPIIPPGPPAAPSQLPAVVIPMVNAGTQMQQQVADAATQYADLLAAAGAPPEEVAQVHPQAMDALNQDLAGAAPHHFPYQPVIPDDVIGPLINGIHDQHMEPEPPPPPPPPPPPVEEEMWEADPRPFVEVRGGDTTDEEEWNDDENYPWRAYGRRIPPADRPQIPVDANGLVEEPPEPHPRIPGQRAIEGPPENPENQERALVPVLHPMFQRPVPAAHFPHMPVDEVDMERAPHVYRIPRENLVPEAPLALEEGPHSRGMNYALAELERRELQEEEEDDDDRRERRSRRRRRRRGLPSS